MLPTGDVAMKLYYMQGACSLAPHLILEESGLPYETVLLSRDRGDLDKPEFLKLNPMGAVPVLAVDDGNVLTENVAILPYIADLAKGKKLIPQAGTFERARCLQSLAFLATEMHTPFRFIFGAQHFGGGDEKIADAFQKRGKEISQHLFDLLESKLPASGFILGQDYSVVDAYTFVFHSWAQYLEFDLKRWPKYGALVSRIAERPATKKVLKDEELLD